MWCTILQNDWTVDQKGSVSRHRDLRQSLRRKIVSRLIILRKGRRRLGSERRKVDGAMMSALG